jgi:hypothetical protein
MENDWVIIKSPTALQVASRFLTRKRIIMCIQMILILGHIDWRYIALLRWLNAYNKYAYLFNIRK